jgi:hypothetical protein
VPVRKIQTHPWGTTTFYPSTWSRMAIRNNVLTFRLPKCLWRWLNRVLRYRVGQQIDIELKGKPKLLPPSSGQNFSEALKSLYQTWRHFLEGSKQFSSVQKSTWSVISRTVSVSTYEWVMTSGIEQDGGTHVKRRKWKLVLRTWKEKRSNLLEHSKTTSVAKICSKRHSFCLVSTLNEV